MPSSHITWVCGSSREAKRFRLRTAGQARGDDVPHGGEAVYTQTKGHTRRVATWTSREVITHIQAWLRGIRDAWQCRQSGMTRGPDLAIITQSQGDKWYQPSHAT